MSKENICYCEKFYEQITNFMTAKISVECQFRLETGAVHVLSHTYTDKF